MKKRYGFPVDDQGTTSTKPPEQGEETATIPVDGVWHPATTEPTPTGAGTDDEDGD